MVISVIYPVVKVRRRGGYADPRMYEGRHSSLVHWSVSSDERTDQGNRHGARYGSTARGPVLRTVVVAVWLDPMVVSGMDPSYVICLMGALSRRISVELVETRRLELLTLSLQRRCSAS